MMHRIPILLALIALLPWAMSGCNPVTSTGDQEGTIVARVVATLQSAETASAATQTPPEPTATPVPEPTAIPGPTVTPPPEIETKEYAVYSALIRQNPIGYNLGSPILIRDQTVSGVDALENALKHTDPLPTRLAESYRSRNAALYALQPNLDAELDYALMPEDEFQEIFSGGGSVWDRLQDRYPDARGVVFFSRVGFDANEDEALVLMGYRCGDLCGSGGLYRLVKEEGSWQVQESLMEWMS